jgi:hypothetical protein
MTVLQDMATKWTTAYNSGEAGKIADLYVQDAIFSSGVLGTLKGKAEIEKALVDQMKSHPSSPSPQRQPTRTGMSFGAMVNSRSPMDRAGISGNTLINNAGSWHIAMHISNVNPPKKQ